MADLARISARSMADAQQLLFNLQRLAGPEFRKQCQEAVRTEVAEPIAKVMKARANTRQRVKAATSLRVNKASKPTITYGRSGTKVAKAIAMGAEFGGQQRWAKYWTRRGGSKPFQVTRRTTMQFAPHLGREGYFVNPAWRSQVEGAAPAVVKYSEVINRLIAQAVSE